MGGNWEEGVGDTFTLRGVGFEGVGFMGKLVRMIAVEVMVGFFCGIGKKSGHCI